MVGSSRIAVSFAISASDNRRFHAVKEQPGDRQPDPDNEPEQADDINGGQPADALFPELLEVRHDADGKEGHHEENAAKDVGLAHRRLDFSLQAGANTAMSRIARKVIM